jgi:hypothetical protein
MKHSEMKEWLCLSHYGELNADEQRQLQAHLEGCAECRAERQQLETVHAALNSSTVVVSNRLLMEARGQLHAALVPASSKQSAFDAVAAFITDIVSPRYRIAFGAVALVVFGLFIGYIVFSPHGLRVSQTPAALSDAQQQAPRSDAPIDEQQPLAGDDESAASTAGSDETTANFRMLHLVRTLRDEGNPGVRLKAVRMLLTQSGNMPRIDTVLREALISSLRRDGNPAMRLAVLNVLRLHVREKEIQHAMADAAARDKNSGVRVAAINCLAEARLEGYELDRNAIAVLKAKLQFDKNIFIRTQSRNILQEGTQL